MRNVILFIFIGLAIPSHCQDRSDFIDCLNLIFEDDNFQPAFVTDHFRRGNLIILSGKSYLRNDRFKLRDFRQSLTQEDFYNANYDVKVYRAAELEPLGIPDYAVLELNASGDANQISFRLSTDDTVENLSYNWVYRLVKENEEWEITGHTLRKERVVYRN